MWDCMLPMLNSTNFEGMRLIRPLYCVLERDIVRWAEFNHLEFIACACKFTQKITGGDDDSFSARKRVKALIAQMQAENDTIESNIFQSIHNVQLDTFVEYKQNGVRHNYLETFEKNE